jgi:hypothetical protein
MMAGGQSTHQQHLIEQLAASGPGELSEVGFIGRSIDLHRRAVDSMSSLLSGTSSLSFIWNVSYIEISGQVIWVTMRGGSTPSRAWCALRRV